MIMRIALRNIFRNKWRTALTAGGIAVATALLIWITAFTDAFIVQMVRGATAVKTGQIQIHHPDYAERPSLFSHFALDETMLSELKAIEGVEGAAPRIYTFGLMGDEKNSLTTPVMGVLPDAEAETTLLDESIQKGRWLSNTPAQNLDPRETVIGEKLAKQINAEIDGIFAIRVYGADGAMLDENVKVVGIIKSGNTEVDRSAFMHLTNLWERTSLEGRVHEIALATTDFNDLEPTVAKVKTVVGGHDADSVGLLSRSWQTFNKTLFEMLEMSQGSIGVIYIIIFGIAGLGILNTQRMAALERKREFGVLLAIGLKPRQMAVMVTIEATILTLVGAITGVLMGAAIVGYYAAYGFNMAEMSSTGGDFTYMGVAFNEPVFFIWDLSAFLAPVLVVTIMGSLFGLWPAIKSARLNAIQAISGRI